MCEQVKTDSDFDEIKESRGWIRMVDEVVELGENWKCVCGLAIRASKGQLYLYDDRTYIRKKNRIESHVSRFLSLWNSRGIFSAYFTHANKVQYKIFSFNILLHYTNHFSNFFIILNMFNYPTFQIQDAYPTFPLNNQYIIRDSYYYMPCYLFNSKKNIN